MDNLSRADLLALLDDIRARVAAGDSFEGWLHYLIPDNPDAAHPFDVAAAYRIGNRDGQGGMRLIGHPQLTEQEAHP
ncbi:hypothetical protein [Phaeacidiphilus oryzae]|uniref:hypothetical protein n=1 Tax=Phaeacidiphilus oryzae TaxID=348818 RepID=UPI0005691F83|nr:hypothetical protein [Phaeacidiphilus oryzae]